ncbi:hypothetical protein IAU60_001551 [Kwoniella sp. DSM 27419]
MYGSQSPSLGREPLLASAQTPGRSQRLSDSSLQSYEHSPSHSHMSHRGNTATAGAGLGAHSPSYSSFSSGSRFGPTANLAPSGSKVPLNPSGAAFNRPYTHGQMDDDDDLDDPLHTFLPGERKDLKTPFDITSWRGWANALTLILLAIGGIMLFAGYPILAFYYGNNTSSGSNTSGYNLGGINATGQFPEIPGLPSLIDPDTPKELYTRTGFDGNEWTLVWSDEFNVDGRTFYEGDDPFLQAMDIHYWPTGDFEWLDPSAVTTKDGHLVITMTQEPIHDLNFKSGMLQSWNKLCFNKNAYWEVSMSMPGDTIYGGFWPGIWAMGNLGRAGYGASTEGMWPYTYDSCDIGTLENQTTLDGLGPELTLTTGDKGTPISKLPGQRCSACTCAGEDHPGPNNGVGRAAPEIDMVEAQIILREQRGEVSQSFQLAPFDDSYRWNNISANFEMYDTDLTYWNTYLGGYYQQAASALTRLPRDIYYSQPGTNGQFTTFAFEYQAFPDKREDGYIAWVADGKRSWTMHADATGPNEKVGIGRRIIPEEPMYLIFNFHMSNNFQTVNFANLQWPNYVRVDYARVYQRTDAGGTMGCDPPDYPTADYIDRHKEVYSNPNLTTWAGAGNTWPKNSLKDGCRGP